MKVSELKDERLDYWAGKADQRNVRLYTEAGEKRAGIFFAFDSSVRLEAYSPSTDWSQGGPIIEREQLAIIPVVGGTRWSAERDAPTSGDDYEVYATYGEAPLIAAMRCYVASKFGEEVPDE